MEIQQQRRWHKKNGCSDEQFWTENIWNQLASLLIRILLEYMFDSLGRSK